MTHLRDFMKDYEKQEKLMSLVLDGNHLYDEGIIEIGHALKDRFQSIETF